MFWEATKRNLLSPGTHMPMPRGCNPSPWWDLVTMYYTNVAYWVWRLCSCYVWSA